MNLNTRLNKLEVKTGANKGLIVILCMHPDDWEGELGPGCYRQSEIDRVPSPPNTKVRYLLQLGHCLRTGEAF